MKKHLVLFLFMFALLPLIFAKPIIPSQQFTTGYELQYTPLDYQAFNKTLDFHVHVYYIDNGTIANTTNCYVHLYLINGTETATTQLSLSHGIEYSGIINARNFTTLGDMGFITYCNDAKYGGFASGTFTVNKMGREFQLPYAILDGFILLLLISVAAFFLAFSYQSQREGVKLFYSLISLIFIVLGMGILIVISQQSSLNDTIYKIVFASFFALGIVALVTFFYVMINIIVQSLSLMKERKGLSDVENSRF